MAHRLFWILIASFFLAAQWNCHQNRPPVPTSQPVPTTAPITAPAAYTVPKNHIPKITEASAWPDSALQVNALIEDNGKLASAKDLDAKAKLAWDDENLRVQLTVHDPTWAQAPVLPDDNRRGAEIFVGKLNSSTDSYRLKILPGSDPVRPLASVTGIDQRLLVSSRVHRITANAVTNPLPDGYSLDVKIPWSNLNFTPRVGLALDFRLTVNGSDSTGRTLRARWQGEDVNCKNTVRLAEDVSSPLDITAAGTYEHQQRVVVGVVGIASYVGKTAELLRNGDVIDAKPLVLDESRAVAQFLVPLPPLGQAMGTLAVRIDNATRAKIYLTALKDYRAEALRDASIVFQNSVFYGDGFPSCDFANPQLAETLMGRYTLHSTFYDADFKRVYQPSKPGRYGAIIEVTPEAGKPFKRFVTLFREAEKVVWRESPIHLSGDFPPGVGIPSDAAQIQSRMVSKFFHDDLMDQFLTSQNPAILFAGLFETKGENSALPDRLGPTERDRIWWYNLKKKVGEPVKLKYKTILPAGYSDDTEKKWPLVIFLHGIGERGDNISDVLKYGLPKTASSGRKFPFIIVAPQCPYSQTWLPVQLNDLIDEFNIDHRVDTSQIYMTGMSMGGIGTWAFAHQYPRKLAAALPMAGFGDPSDVAVLKDLPIWSFHGDKDERVPVSMDERTVDALKAIGGNVQFTKLENWPHETWWEVYARKDIYDWLLKQQRK